MKNGADCSILFVTSFLKRRFVLSFYAKYIMLNTSEYESFENFNFYINVFLILLTVGLCIGVFVLNFRKNAMIRIVKQLYRHGATSEESAKTLGELRLQKSFINKRLLADDSHLLRYALCRVGAVRLTYEEYVEAMKNKKRAKKEQKKKRLADRVEEEEKNGDSVDFETARFYIPSEKDLEAKRIISKNPTSLWQNVLISVFLFSITACLVLVMPELLMLVSSLLA